jgi:OPA family glycerol-3-phosphate transporter-like MFS transporter
VFVTAYDHYAVRAFEEHAVDYSLKPFRPERLASAIERVRAGLAHPEALARQLQQVLASVGSARAERPERLERLTVRIGQKQLIVKTDDVLWFGAEDKLVFAATASDRHYVNFTLDELERKLEPSRFVRVHRSAIANWTTPRPCARLRRHVAAATDDPARTEVPVSRSRARQLGTPRGPDATRPGAGRAFSGSRCSLPSYDLPTRPPMSTQAIQPVVYPQLTAEFKNRRTLNWLAVGLLYAFFYTTRYNWTVVSPKIANVLGWGNAQLGVFETWMPIVYACSVILNGPIADRIGGKKAFLFGAVGVVIMNVLFGLASTAIVAPAVWEGVKASKHMVTPAVLKPGVDPKTLLNFMAITWGLNGFFQAFGALSIVKINAHWFHVRERGTFSGVFGVLIRLGLLLAFQGVPLILLAFPWQYAFWIPAACVALFFFICLGFVHNSPAEAKLGEFETGDASDSGTGPASLGFVISKIFASRATWTIALCSMMIGFVRRSHLDSWWPRYFEQYHGADPSGFASFAPYVVATWGIALAGIAGGSRSASSDRRFGGRRRSSRSASSAWRWRSLSGVGDHCTWGR